MELNCNSQENSYFMVCVLLIACQLKTNEFRNQIQTQMVKIKKKDFNRTTPNMC